MKHILFFLLASVAGASNSAVFYDRGSGRVGYNSADDFSVVANDASFDNFKKVEEYCEKKYPGFLIKSQNASWCIEGINSDIENIRRISRQWMPEKRAAMFDYPNSLSEFEAKIKSAFKISNTSLVFDTAYKKKVDDYFRPYELQKQLDDSRKANEVALQAERNIEQARLKKEDDARLALEAEEKALKEKARKEAAAEHKAALAAKRIAPSDFDEAIVFYGSTDAYELATSPKVAADKKTYHSVGHIELTPDEKTFIARIKSGAEGIVSPYARQLMRELGQLSGRTKEPYFSVRVPPSLQKVYLEHARMNKPMRVIGVYSGNTEITMTTNQTVKIPVLDAVFFDFGGEAMYGLGFPKTSRP